ncbi:YczE/YyaS/YitT family protein [Enterococcus sp. LJL120]
MRMTRVNLFMMISGNILLGFCIAVLRFINLGTDPFSAMNIGLAQVSQLSYGVAQLGVNLILFIFQFIFARRTIGWGSLMNLALLAFISDFFLMLIETSELASPSLVVSLILLIPCLLLMAFSLSLYISSDLGVAPYDSLAIFLPERIGIPFRLCRIMTDAFCVVVAFFTGSAIGIGTLAIVLLTGPLVQWFNENVSNKIQEKLSPAVAELEE